MPTSFAPEPYDVVTKTGNSVVVESPDGVQLMRNTANVKKYEETSQNPEKTIPLLDVTDPVEPEAQLAKLSSPVVTRPTRVRKLAKRYKDFVMT